jgi:hypothetical protein
MDWLNFAATAEALVPPAARDALPRNVAQMQAEVAQLARPELHVFDFCFSSLITSLIKCVCVYGLDQSRRGRHAVHG